MAPRIPLDICFEIITQGLADPKPRQRAKTLSAWALTSRALSGRAQRQLYRDVYISECNTLQLFARTIKDSPSLGQLVKTLEVHFETEESKPVEDLEIPQDALRHLLNLRNLTFDFDGDAPEVLMQNLTALGDRLEVLSIERVNFSSAGDILRLLACFPRLSSLELNGCFWSEHDIPPLEELGENFGRALVTLTSLYNWDEEAILCMMPQGIQRLSVGMPMPDPHDDVMVDEINPRIPQSFARFTNLTFLELMLNLSLPDNDMDTLNALQECRLLTLEELSLDFFVGSKISYAEVVQGLSALVDALHALLSSDPFPALKKITVSLNMKEYAKDHPMPDPYGLKRALQTLLDPVLREYKPSGVALAVNVDPSVATLPSSRYLSGRTGAA